MNWPVSSYTPGTYPWFQVEIANAMGLPQNPANLNHSQRAQVHSVITAGLGRFYHPQPSQYTIPEATEAQKERLRRAPHAWTFLTNWLSLNLTQGTTEYTLPANFAGFIGEPTTSRSSGRISVVSNPDQIEQLNRSSVATGQPRYAAHKIVPGAGTAPVSHRLIVYPAPAASETIRIQHSIVPPLFDEDHIYLACGDEHIETVRACCLAEIAERGDGDPTIAIARMNERMAASMMRDQQTAIGVDGVWPDEDEMSPGMNRAYFESEIGRLMKYGPNSRVWSDSQRREIAEIFRRALHRVCNNALIPGDKYPHQWSFLRPTASILLVAGQAEYDLPADFAMFHGPITYKPGQYRWFEPIQIYGEHQIRQMEQYEYSSSYPRFGAIRSKTFDDNTGTRYELVLWPPPDVPYEISFRYRVNPEALVQ